MPKAAAEAIQKAAEGGTIKQLEKSEARAELKKEGEKGTIVKLASPLGPSPGAIDHLFLTSSVLASWIRLLDSRQAETD